jgi:hypothetical protein
MASDVLLLAFGVLGLLLGASLHRHREATDARAQYR